MSNIMIGILVSIGVTLVVLLFFQHTRKYFKHAYPMLFWTGLVALVATLSGVTVAFRMETERQRQIQQDVFAHHLIGLLYETASNIRNIRGMREDFTPTGVNIKHIRSDVAEALLGDPRTYEYGAQGLFQAAWIMVDSIDTYNQYSDFARLHFETRGFNTEKTLSDISGTLDQAEYRIRIMQRVLDIYNVQHFQTVVWKEPEYDQIYSWIHGKIDFTRELERMREEEKETQPSTPHAPGHAASVNQEARETFMQTEDGHRLKVLLNEEAELIRAREDSGGNVGGKLTAEEQERFLELGDEIAELERKYDGFERASFAN